MLTHFTLAFGFLANVGGLIGFLKAKSKASLIAGCISGDLLLVAWWLLKAGDSNGNWLALAVSLLLAGQFVPKFIATRKFMPAGLMAVLSVVELVLLAIGFLC